MQAFKKFNLQENVELKKFTTWRVGGPAEYLIESTNSVDLEEILNLANQQKIKTTILGNGSNVLISDEGIKGLVVINKSKNIQIGNNFKEKEGNSFIHPRHVETGDLNYYSFSDLDYEESGDGSYVTFDSGVMLPYAINWTLNRNLTGLQWFAGIPGTIGGSFYNNIHGGTKHFSDNFFEAKIIDSDGKTKLVGFDFFNFGYDQSVIRQNPNIFILSVTLKLINGDIEKAKYVAKEWLKRKSIQPKNSCGSVFQALSPEIQQKLNYPTPSVGYIVDKVLDWKGKKIGEAKISEVHGNFIENIGNAKAKDIKDLIEQIQIEVKEKIGIQIDPEINFLGF